MCSAEVNPTEGSIFSVVEKIETYSVEALEYRIKSTHPLIFNSFYPNLKMERVFKLMALDLELLRDKKQQRVSIKQGPLSQLQRKHKSIFHQMSIEESDILQLWMKFVISLKVFFQMLH